MKISISTDGGEVSRHFGRCPEFLIAEVLDGKILNTKRVPNPGHEPGAIPEFLFNMGVECAVCGGIGTRATELFNANGIKIISGVGGSVDKVLQDFADGKLKSGDFQCTPGSGRGYGIDKSVCDHAHED